MMSYKVPFLVCTVLLLSACAENYWPGQNAKDGLLSASDYLVVQKRYETASKKALGTAKDIEEIKEAIRKSHPEMEISDMRWVSSTEVIAYVECNKTENLGHESFYCAVEKDTEDWRVVACYLDSIA